jgi:hypothetical protein
LARKKNKKKKKATSKGKQKRPGKKPGKKAPAKPSEARADGEPPVAGQPSVDSEATVPSRPPVDGEPALEGPAVIDGDEDLTVIDLDADPDVAEAVERLIAETVATAAVEPVEAEPEAPVVDLDTERDASTPHDEPPESRDGEIVAPGEQSDPRAETVADPAEEEALRRLVDLGPVSSPEVRERLLAAALAHSEHQDARYRVPFSATGGAARWKAFVASVLLLGAGAAAIAPPQWARPAPPARLTSSERAQSLRMALLLQAQQVEAFRVRTQRLPVTLAELTRTLPGVRYVRSGSRGYQLIAYEADGNAIVYDSTDPTPAFDDLATGWAAQGAGV